MTKAKVAPDLKKLMTGAQLPALPQSAIRLLELSQDPENGPAEFAVPIESDPGLTGQVLRFVNSSYFGFSREISSIKLAITLVGIRTIKNFALWSAVFSLMPNPKCGPFDLKSLWQDSLRRALFARAFGKLLGMKDAEDLFAAALLQDMAVPLLARELPQQYAELFNRCASESRRLSQLEQEEFGWSHAQAAATMARHWSLPEEFAVLIEAHTELATMLESDKAQPSQLSVGLSSLLPAAHHPAWPDREAFESAYRRILASRETPLGGMLERIDREFTEFAPVLKISTPVRSLVDRLAEKATVGA